VLAKLPAPSMTLSTIPTKSNLGLARSRFDRMRPIRPDPTTTTRAGRFSFLGMVVVDNERHAVVGRSKLPRLVSRVVNDMIIFYRKREESWYDQRILFFCRSSRVPVIARTNLENWRKEQRFWKRCDNRPELAWIAPYGTVSLKSIMIPLVWDLRTLQV
jgi:hypothetical protein